MRTIREFMWFVAIICLLGALPVSAWADGFVAHSMIVERAISLLDSNDEYGELKALLEKEMGVVKYGAMFPDWGYMCLWENDYVDIGQCDYEDHGEVAHNNKNKIFNDENKLFRETFICQMINNPSLRDDKSIAFLFGLISHQDADNLWHWPDPPENPKGFLHVLYDYGFGGGKSHMLAEMHFEVFLANFYPPTSYFVDWFLPKALIKSTYREVGKPVSELTLIPAAPDWLPSWASWEAKTINALDLGKGIQQGLYSSVLNTSWSTLNLSLTMPYLTVFNTWESYPRGGLQSSADSTVKEWKETWGNLNSPGYCDIVLHPRTGTYTTATKFGGATGTWYTFHDMEITDTDEVYLDGVMIKNPTFNGNTLSWTMADGNAGNANITFKALSDDTYYWDLPISGQIFEGTYQNPGEGPLDFRGIVLHPRTGTYTTATKFGGATGTWYTFHDMEITDTDEVFLDGVMIKNPTFNGNTLSWTMADGNAGNAIITFKALSDDTYYWDLPISGQIFEGTYQNPGEGPLDFRGIVLHPRTGTYTTATKFGGATGTWYTFHDMEITDTDEVFLDGVMIKNPTFNFNTLSWTMADGNAGNANITFKALSDDTYYWDLPVSGQIFEGTYQNPGEGPLDFRGLDANNYPSVAQLVYPANGQNELGTTVTLKWKKCTDPDGDVLTYNLYICEDTALSTGCMNKENIASLRYSDIYYAGTGAGLFLVGIVFAGGMINRKKIALILAMMMILVFLTVSCGSGGGGDDDDDIPPPGNEVVQVVSGLKSSTTYYWMVVAKDDKGGETSSEIRSFKTQ